MSEQDQSGIASRIARLSTGLKMFLILSLALLPLGLIAILASVESAREDSERRREGTLTRLEVKAQRIDTLLSRTSATIRAASAAIALTPPASKVCETTLERLGRTQGAAGRYALFSNGAFRCATSGYRPQPALSHGRRSVVEIAPGGETLRFALFDEQGRLEGMGEFPRQSIADLTFLPGTSGDFDLDLWEGERRMRLRDQFTAGALVQTVQGTQPVAAGRMHLDIRLSAAPITLVEVMTILLPVLMWLFAALIGWIIVNWLLVKPLARMQQAISAYKPGDRQLALPALASPAREIGELGAAFNQVTQTVTRHEADLEAAVERQTKLVREVHHRVKNNLQVVASLLNLHARGAPSEDVAAAYASIQRRVDALAVVHRNHYAELEENRGVSMKSLISELGANLKATAPPSAAGLQIRLDIEPYYVTQDVAVSVAFLITEVVEYAMFCGAQNVAISMLGTAASAQLTIESDSLSDDLRCDEKLTDRFDRIVTGLSRQLRSTIERDLERGRYSLPISVLDKAER